MKKQLLLIAIASIDFEFQLEIMSARNLRPMDTNGSCDPFVRVHFLPESEFSNVIKWKTNAQQKTLFPLFEEKFSIALTEEQLKVRNPLLLFSVKDKDLFGMANQYIAEALLSLETIKDGSASEQIHLTLTRPSNMGEWECSGDVKRREVINLILPLDNESLRALELRQFDKQAKEFIKKLKQKANNQA